MTSLVRSATRSIVFPHVMKTAGTSLIAWIQRHFHYHEILFTATTWPELLRLPRGALSGKRFVRGHFGSGIVKIFGEDKGFTPIAVLRDPIERVVSHFWHLKFAPEAHPFPFVRPAHFTIEQFVEHPATQCVVSNYQTANFSATLDSQSASATDPPAELRALEEVSAVDLEGAKAFIDSCAVVGVTEELPALMSRLSHCFGFYPKQRLPRLRSYRPAEPIANAVLEKIRELNAVDFELYQYVRERAQVPARLFSIAERVNPNAVGPDGMLRWVAGMPYWGDGWSDVMADERKKHIWSLEPSASLEFVVRPGECYTLLFSLQRFVTPLQKECFSVLCNGKEVSIVPVFSINGDDQEVSAVVLGPAETDTLTITFRVTTLFAFQQITEKDPSTLRRGVALSGINLLASHPGTAFDAPTAQPAPNGPVDS